MFSDPRLDEVSSVLIQWQAVIGKEPITARRLIEKATEQGYSSDFIHGDFREALLAVAAQGGLISSKRLGIWIAKQKKWVVQGRSIEDAGVLHGVQRWQLVDH